MTGLLRTRLTAAVTAVAVGIGALSATATPAAALSDDGRQALGWAVGIGAAALLLNELDKDKDRRRAAPARVYTPPAGYYDGRHDRYDRYDRDDRGDRRAYRSSRNIVPASCLMQVRTRDGRREVVDANCARRALGRVELPRSCAFDLLTDHGRPERVYGRNCLEDRGFRLGRY